MIDLHIHTIYSDGDFDENKIGDRISECSRMSVTDHNSVYMYFRLNELSKFHDKQLSKLVVGTEVTTEGYPDYLLYFPKIAPSDINKLREIEFILKDIRQQEEKAVRKAYEYLKQNDPSVNYSDWDSDFNPYSPAWDVVLEARTRDLAAMRYRIRTNSTSNNFFEKEDLLQARIARRNSSVDQQQCNPFHIARQTDGELALAHPIRSAYILSNREEGGLEAMECKLNELFADFLENGGKIVEWEYLDVEASRYQLINNYHEQLRELVANAIDNYGLKCVWGTDSHKHFPQNSREWSEQCAEKFKNNMPEWL